MTDLETPITRGPVDVWAPAARTVELQLRGDRVAMTAADDGWFTADVGTLADLDGADYGYRIDGDETVIPDPRSRRQPAGVHQASAVFDPSTYAWGDAAWTGRPLAGGVVYELHIGTFTPEGTFEAAIGKLDHLVDLGVNFVEVLPVNDFNGEWNWGYDGVLWYAVHEPYGGPAGYQAFVDACHQAGLGVIQDVVYNHLGPSGNYLSRFGPYLGDTSANTWGLSVNLDGAGSDEVRRYIIDNALMWLADYHVDGLRLDAVHALVDSRAEHILESLATAADDASAAVGRPLTLIAESDMNNPALITSREAGGQGLAAQWSDDFHHAVHANLTGEANGYYADFASIGALAKVFSRGFYHDGTYSSFRKRHHGRPIDRLRMPPSRLVVFAQDHDQIGNRAAGDRLSATLDTDLLALAAVLVILSPFTPMLFMGEEWGASTPWQFFTSHPEPELGEATAKGRIEEFVEMGWDESVVPDPQDPETFRRSKLDWSEAAEGEHAELFGLYRRLVHLRREFPAFTDQHLDRVRVECDQDARWIAVHRGNTVVAANLGTEPAPIAVRLAQPLEQRGDVRIEADSVRLGAHAFLVATTA